ncbi:membrane glycoprotein UL119 [Saimiriine betaherpesvirus 4]|uniref:Membrane glycoprotein UL119 n=1 Tax=Saimiriine betaherpesvirus 4 TaxID=1535247 RepID=G8XT15_9BETA|nr:membrane glycoprotein UL119 [Saimiriine betaherpesvirus 4]AEV80962.1 membrane glycoprotein UL119 [Saimiriine betaherpesvirus 4]
MRSCILLLCILPLSLAHSNFSVSCHQHHDYEKHVMNSTCKVNYNHSLDAPDLMAIECFKKNVSTHDGRRMVGRVDVKGGNATDPDVQIFYNNTEQALHLNSHAHHTTMYECDFIAVNRNITSKWIFHGSPVLSTYIKGTQENYTFHVLMIPDVNFTVTLLVGDQTMQPCFCGDSNRTEGKEFCFLFNHTVKHVTLKATSSNFNYTVTYTLVWAEDDAAYVALIYTVTLLFTLMLTLLSYVIYRCLYYLPLIKYHRLLSEEKPDPCVKKVGIKV